MAAGNGAGAVIDGVGRVIPCSKTCRSVSLDFLLNLFNQRKVDFNVYLVNIN